MQKRRMIEGDYKILFKNENAVIYIMAVFPSKNNPKIKNYNFLKQKL